jgi:hypothetical protein
MDAQFEVLLQSQVSSPSTLAPLSPTFMPTDAPAVRLTLVIFEYAPPPPADS